MTFERILDGLTLVVLRLANGGDISKPPPDWQPHEWAYVRGIASNAVLMLIRNLKS